jgi:pyrroloquinoline quinone biosynthesis protein B
LLVLGIAQDAGYPQVGCQKTCCLHLKEHPEDAARVACLGLVDPVSRSCWLFDATPDFTAQYDQLLQSAGAERLAGIFLTHGHIGHYTGLMYLGREAMGAKGMPVYAMPRMEQFLNENGPWSQLISLSNISIHPLQADSVIRLNERLTVQPLLVPHRDEFTETVGYRISGPNRTALFIPDIDKWEKWDRSIETEIAAADLAILDGTFYAAGELPGRNMAEVPHPFVTESMARFQALDAAKKAGIYFIHFNHTNPLLMPESEARRELLHAGFGIATAGGRWGL